MECFIYMQIINKQNKINPTRRSTRINISFSYKYVYLILLNFLILNVNSSNELAKVAINQRLLSSPQHSSYYLNGIHSYVKYSPWQPCLNETFEFEFKTADDNCLILYTQFNPYTYIQVSLINGYLRVKLRIHEIDEPDGISLEHLVNRLNDDEWHHIIIKRFNEFTNLIVDNEKTYTYKHKYTNFNLDYSNHINNDVDATTSLFVFGGLPNYIQTYDLSLSAVLFEKRLNGSIRNVRLYNCTVSYMTKLDFIEYNGLSYINNADACASNPCLNNGICLVNDFSYFCDCSYVNYEGRHCEILKLPTSKTELTFDGRDYYQFEIATNNSLSQNYEEELNLEFKTSRPNGLLTYASDGQDYFAAGLKDGVFYLKLDIKGQIFQKNISIPLINFHNNNWHSVRITRKAKRIDIVIDDLDKMYELSYSQLSTMRTKFIYMGGAPKDSQIFKTYRKNFVGCLRNTTFRTEAISLNLIELTLNDKKFNEKNDNTRKTCRNITDPVTFNSPESYIPILSWKNYPKLFSFSIEFQTIENHGILAYILGSSNPNSNMTNKIIRNRRNDSFLEALNRDFFALEIHNRFLHVYINYGSNYYRHEVVHELVSSGKPHQIQVEFHGNYVTLKFDQKPPKTIRIDSDNDALDLEGPLVIGGIYPSHTGAPFTNPSKHIPPYFFSGILNHGYVGCIHDVVINGEFVNLTHYATLESVSGISTDMCTPMPNQCSTGHCINNGICLEGWNRFICDCTATGFNGPVCNQPAIIANFALGQFIRIKFETEWVTEAEHLSFRFKTKKQNCVLLSTYSQKFQDFMDITLENSSVRLSITIGNVDQILYSSRGLSDDTWHTVKVTREGKSLMLQVDGNEPAIGNLSLLETNKHELQLVFSYMDLGSSIFFEKNPYFRNKSNHKLFSYGNIDIGDKAYKKHSLLKNYSPFEGQMQQLIINGKSYFELIDNNEIPNIINKTATFLRNDIIHRHPITFYNNNSWLELPKIDASQILLIQFHFKTLLENGLILYNPGENGDFLSVELLNGQICYMFSLGKGIHKIKSQFRQKLNDNKWHLVSIWRSTRTSHELTVDSLLKKHALAEEKHLVFNLVDSLSVGGLKDDDTYGMLKSRGHIFSTHGFQGCLASLEINGQMPNYDEIWNNVNKIKGNISKGCGGRHKCKSDSKICLNGGKCEQHPVNNEIICNCELTTYVGNRCEKRSKGFRFEQNESLITFKYNISSVPKEDILVFGVETREKNGVLFKAKFLNREILAQIVNGLLNVSYSVDDHVNNNIFQLNPINDGKYHVIKFRGEDSSSTVEIDNFSHVKQTIILNSTNTNIRKNVNQNVNVSIQIGGLQEYHLSSKANYLVPTIKDQFTGSIYGLVFNKIRILDLITNEDNRGELIGKVTLIPEEFVGNNNNYQNNTLICENSADCDESNETISSVEIEEVKLTTKIPPKQITTKSSATPTKSMKNDQKGSKFEDNKNNQNKNNNNKITKEGTNSLHNTTQTTTAKKNIMDNYKFSEFTLTTYSTLFTTTSENKILKQQTSSNDKLSTGVIIGIVIGSLIALILIIYAIYKYLNRDEGTYTIDETKNFGPFADLDVNSTSNSNEKTGSLNCGKKSKSSKKTPAHGNKEWYV